MLNKINSLFSKVENNLRKSTLRVYKKKYFKTVLFKIASAISYRRHNKAAIYLIV